MFENIKTENSSIPVQDKDYKIEDVPIYTMKKDLENAGNPDYKNAAGNAAVQPASPDSPRISLEKQKNSPFLSQSKPPKKEGAPLGEKKEANWQKLILIGVFVFMLLTFGTGGYYFWITQFAGQNQNVPETAAVPEEETLALSIENPNYLSIDIDSPDSSKIRETIEKYAGNVSASGALTPLEFIVTDKKNNPVGFEKFASEIGINFPPDLLSSLNSENKFSLFIYNDSDKTRLGLAVDSKDDYKLKNSLFQEEANLPNDLAPLLQNISFDSAEKVFSSGSYANTEIRYTNLTSQNDLTIDYAIFKNKLVIGTTKMTIQAIMDYINNHSEVQGAEDVIDDANAEE
jgi:hypothetical protein